MAEDQVVGGIPILHALCFVSKSTLLKTRILNTLRRFSTPTRNIGKPDMLIGGRVENARGYEEEGALGSGEVEEIGNFGLEELWRKGKEWEG